MVISISRSKTDHSHNPKACRIKQIIALYKIIEMKNVAAQEQLRKLSRFEFVLTTNKVLSF